MTLAEADARLGRRVPLPTRPLPLPRWVEVHATGERAVEVEWNLDDSRGGPGRLALYAGPGPPPAGDERAGWGEPRAQDGLAHREAPLPEAEPSLRPAHELSWTSAEGLHLRLTAQGPWALAELRAIAGSVE